MKTVFGVVAGVVCGLTCFGSPKVDGGYSLNRSGARGEWRRGEGCAIGGAASCYFYPLLLHWFLELRVLYRSALSRPKYGTQYDK